MNPLKTQTPTQNSQKIWIDAHVHIHDCFPLDQLLNSALKNFQQVSQTESPISLLFLTEIQGINEFKKLLIYAESQPNNIAVWTFYKTQEPFSIEAKNQQNQSVFIIAGRQIVTAEKLEVLALITDKTVEDGLPLETTLTAIQAMGGISVLPWGVGKWIGKRGKLLNHLLNSDQIPLLFLGDNSARPIFWLRPPYFKLAEQKGWQVLPGTDPLSLATEASRPGSFGFNIEGEFNPQKPGNSIKQILLNSQTKIQPYGRLENPVRFIQNQLAIRSHSSAKMQPQEQTIVSTNGFPETADIETSSDGYASRFAGELGQWLLKVQEEATLKLLATYPQATVLDVGGGHGQITKPLIEKGYQVTVLGSDEICKNRIQTLIDANLCSFQVGNVLDLPYPDNAFDVVISYRFLAHVTQWQKFLSELSRVAKKAVIIDYPTLRSVNSIAPYLFKFKKGLEGNTRTYITYDESELIDFFKSLGLKQTERYPQFFIPMVLHRALKSPTVSSVLEQPFRVSGLTHLLGSPVIAKFTKS